MRYSVIFIFMLLTIFTSCKKDTIANEPAPNWNVQYIGSYKGNWSYANYNMGVVSPYLHKDSVLIISANSADSSLTTSLSNCSVIRYDLSTNSFPIYHGRINFRNDSMFYECANGGLGSGTIENFNGKKL